MTPAEAVERLNIQLAHLWMIRNFLKHAEEIQDEENFLDIHRELYDSIRAVEPAFQRADHKEYLRRLKGKLPKLRKKADFFAQHFRDISPHTNFEMASLSLSGTIRTMEEIFNSITTPVEPDPQ